MIPPDVASRLQLPADAAVARLPSNQQVSDALSGMVPGQRVLAAIQAQLPTGAYRALINQRDITLALPFSAKSGDTLELEVVENNGQRTLAVVSKSNSQEQAASAKPQVAAETFLSRTGNFIAGLLPRGEHGEQAKPAQLNANQPIANAPPAKGADLVPLLKQAITQSGVFYESHQSQWLGSRLPTEALLAQPQGKHSPRLELEQALPQKTTSTPAPIAKSESAAAVVEVLRANAPAEAQQASRVAAVSAQLVAPDLLPLVQQQLEALATQTYVWHGQAWPGQQMQWEIIEENGEQKQGGEAEQAPWQTRLTLTMPQLGEVRANLRIVAGELTLQISAQTSDAAMQLANGGDALRSQLDAAGLKLGNFMVGHHDPAES